MTFEKNLSIQELDQLKTIIYGNFLKNNKEFYKNKHTLREFYSKQFRYYEQKMQKCNQMPAEEIRKHLLFPNCSEGL